MIAAIVFDFDGTLVDSSQIKLDAYYSAMRDHGGGTASEHAEAYLRHGTLNRVEQLTLAFRDVTGRRPDAAETARLVSTYTATYRKHLDKIRVFDGFDDLSAKVSARLAVASNAPQEEVLEICTALGIAQYFTRISGYPTSKVDALRAVAFEALLAPSQILYVGDRPEDGVAADSAGTFFRLIDHTGRAPYGTERLVSSFSEVCAFVDELDARTAR